MSKEKLDDFLQEWREDHKTMTKMHYIIEAIDNYYKSYSHKPHLALLPYDLNTNDPKKLKQRLRACNRELREAQSELKRMKEDDEMMQGFIDDNNRTVEALQKDIDERQAETDRINENMSKVYEHFDRVTEDAKKDAEDLKEWEDEILNSMYLDYGGEKGPVQEGLKHFYEDIVPKGYLGPEDVKFVNELADKIDELPVYDDGYSDGHDRFMGQVTGWSDDMRYYAEKYDIQGDNENTRELNGIDVESDKWYEQTARNDKENKRYSESIGKINENTAKIEAQQKENRHEMGKQETKVNDYKDQKGKIEDKLKLVED